MGGEDVGPNIIVPIDVGREEGAPQEAVEGLGGVGNGWERGRNRGRHGEEGV
jgi:hypothetical protein